jgi:hypothetical protein
MKNPLFFWFKCTSYFYIISMTLVFAILLCFRYLTDIDLFLQINLSVFFVLITAFVGFAYFRKLFFNDKSELILLFLIALLLTYSSTQFMLLNIDRSRSFYVLSWVQNHDIRITNSGYDITEVKSYEKYSKFEIIKRLDEQRIRGLIKVDSSSLDLSIRGSVFYYSADKLAQIFKLDGWTSNKY